MTQLSIKASDSQLLVSGELTRDQVSRDFEKSSYQLINAKNPVINLAGVSLVDTAGLAWLLAMLEHASKQNINLQFTEIPAKLENLAKLSGVAGFLPAK
ncbi:STAS domain-containing protein [Thalassotalea marina]|uniref:STAS domain-containing protein n=1 Tax=Thalassotalea marina TaxID=1673741 RepID=A0A919BAD2_9GAMM|nr:STAS domain-containing protein [Thalassotalea marina]GHF78726.1 hypothetical protein GCM10017161_02260 [Thalassotalea marina]